MEFSQYVLVLFNRNKFAQLITAMILRGLICKHSKLQARKKIKRLQKISLSFPKQMTEKPTVFCFFFSYQLSSQTACRFYSAPPSRVELSQIITWIDLSLFFFLRRVTGINVPFLQKKKMCNCAFWILRFFQTYIFSLNHNLIWHLIHTKQNKTKQKMFSLWKLDNLIHPVCLPVCLPVQATHVRFVSLHEILGSSDKKEPCHFKKKKKKEGKKRGDPP